PYHTHILLAHYTLSLSLSLSLPLSVRLSLTLCLSHSLSLSHTHTHSFSLTPSLSLFVLAGVSVLCDGCCAGECQPHVDPAFHCRYDLHLIYPSSLFAFPNAKSGGGGGGRWQHTE